MSHLRAVEHIINSHGYLVTFTSVGAASRSGTGALTRTNEETSYSVKCHIRDFSPKELAGNFVEMGDRQARIAGEALEVTPKINDKITHNGRTYRVVSVNTRGGADYGDLLHIMQIRG